MKWLIIITILGAAVADYTEEDAVRFAKKVDRKSNYLYTTAVYRDWDYVTSLTDEAADKYVTAQEAYDKYQESIWPEARKYPRETFKDPVLKRLFSFLSRADEAALPVKQRTRINEVVSKMIDIYGTTQIREYGSSPSDAPTLYLNDVAEKFETESDDPCKMAYYWDGWHTTVGTAVKDLFEEDIQLLNELAKVNNFTDSAARWQSMYDTDDFERVLAKLMDQIRPLFQHLHAYVRRQLWISFGKNSKIIDRKSPIPVSLLGNLWGLDTISIYSKTLPFPEIPSPDATPQLVSQKYTGEKMARTAEQFYLSINMSAMVGTFYKRSIFEKPKDRNISCEEMSYNFFTGKDYRFKMCARPTMDYFGRMHYQMGHTENYMAWRNLFFFFQDAPNPAFNSVIGDLMYLFSTNPSYLKQLGLLDKDFEITEEQQINFLYQQASAIVFFLPYAYTLDIWRWGVMQGKITPDNYNREYWRLRLQYQGVEPPVSRDESGVDPAGKYHILSNSHYISYFISGILEFQLHRALCMTAKEYHPDDENSKPLHLCNIYNSTAAGNKLKKMIALGKSHPWPDYLEIVTGERVLNAEPLLEFFRPLYNWLVKENKKTNEKIGWDVKSIRCSNKRVNKPYTNKECQYE